MPSDIEVGEDTVMMSIIAFATREDAEKLKDKFGSRPLLVKAVVDIEDGFAAHVVMATEIEAALANSPDDDEPLESVFFDELEDDE